MSSEITTALPASLTHDLDVAATYARASRAPATVRAYARGWRDFVTWCGDVGGGFPLEASPRAVATYLAHRAEEGAAPASLSLYLSAIAEALRAAGRDPHEVRRSVEVREVMAGIRRSAGVAQRQVTPATSDVIRAMVAALVGSPLARARDRALLLLGFAGAFRRSELAALRVSDLAWSDRGVEVHVRRSKSDQEGAGRIVAIPREPSSDLCPVAALAAWLEASCVAPPRGLQWAALESDDALYVFRALRVPRSLFGRGQLELSGPMSGRDIARAVKRAAARAGLEARHFSGHSLRAGLATSAALAGRGDRAIMAQTGHRSRAMLDRYVRAADRWRDNAARGLL